MFRRRQRKAPKGGHKSGLVRLVEAAKVELAVHGALRTTAAPWLEAADLLIKLQRCCRAVLAHETPAWLVEQLTTNQGWTCRWEGEELVLGLPGWKAPAPRVEAVQPGLFDAPKSAPAVDNQAREIPEN